MRFFDTHTHLDFVALETECAVKQLVQNAKQVGVERILVVAISAKNFDKVTACCACEPQHLVYGLGLHPLYIQQHQQADLVLLEKLLAQKGDHCTTVAEIGLERGVETLLTKVLWKKQCDFLDAQLALAKRYELPVNLHSRHSHDQLFTFLKRIDLPQKGVIHGFAGSYIQAKRFVDLGYKIGVGGTITYARANKTRDVIRKLPLDALLLETDSPDMPVFGFQGKINRPERVVVSFKALCELRPESPLQIAETIWQTSEALFWFKPT